MKPHKIFEDDTSKQLWKQIRDAQIYIHKELDKEITKQLILRVIDMDLLPVLIYPEREPSGVMPMHYSKKKDYQINIHTPIPKLQLFSVDQYVSVFKCEENEFWDALKSMKERVGNLD